MNTHAELNCNKDQVKCPYVEEGKLYTWLQRTGPLPEGPPKDAVMVHPSASALIGAVIGAPLQLMREGAPLMVKRMWPSKASAPAAVILPAAGKLFIKPSLFFVPSTSHLYQKTIFSCNIFQYNFNFCLVSQFALLLEAAHNIKFISLKAKHISWLFVFFRFIRSMEQ